MLASEDGAVFPSQYGQDECDVEVDGKHVGCLDSPRQVKAAIDSFCQAIGKGVSKNTAFYKSGVHENLV